MSVSRRGRGCAGRRWPTVGASVAGAEGDHRRLECSLRPADGVVQSTADTATCATLISSAREQGGNQEASFRINWSHDRLDRVGETRLAGRMPVGCVGFLNRASTE